MGAFIVGCFVGGFIITIVMCCLAMAGRKGDEDENS